MNSTCSLLILIIIGYIDWQHRRIPNKLLLILAGWAAVYAAFSSESSIENIAINIGIGLAITLPGYIKGLVGGGDLKLMLAISPLWTPTQLLCIFSIGIVSLLLLMSFANMIARMSLITAYYPNATTTSKLFHRGVPLGSAIAIGTVFMSFLT